MPDAARAHLEHWLREASDPDAEQLQWKRAYFDGVVLAYERIGLVSSDEGARWRARFADPEQPTSNVRGWRPPEVRDRVESYLIELVGRVPPLTRNPNPAGQEIGAECATALDALHAVGALDDDAYTSWRTRMLKAQAPWLEEPSDLPPQGTFYAIHVPPADEQQAAEDAARAAAWEARPKAREARRVITGSPERHDDLAIIAAVVHEDAVSLHFHYLGGPSQIQSSPHTNMEAFRSTIDRLIPPALRDDHGNTYQAVNERPSSSSGAGGMPDPNRRQAITGHWTYTPAAPGDTSAFTAERDGHRWRLPPR
jgi:hypothetical protein